MKTIFVRAFSILILLLIIIPSTFVFAYTIDYEEKFYYAGYGYGGSTFLCSPFRDANLNEYYPYITSKYSNPRALSSSPHGGVDFGVGIGTNVYPLKNGRIVAYNDTTVDPKFGYYIIVQFDTNGDGQYNSFNNVYARYAHLSKINKKSGEVTTNTCIAESGTTGTTAAHLHVDLRDNNLSTTGVYHSLPWQCYYGNTSNWNTGKDLDWLCGDNKNGRTFNIFCYGKTDGGTDVTPESVKLYIRVRGSSSVWSEYTMNNGGSYYYLCTVPSTDFLSGTNIEYFFCGKRGNLGSYNPYGLYPAKFKAPAIPPDSTKDFARYYSVF